MSKKFVVFFIALLAMLLSTGFVQPIVVYVDTAYVGTEDGTMERPYNTMAEAVSVAQTDPGGAGGVIMVKKNGSYVYDHFEDSVKPGGTGIPLAEPVLFGILATLSLLLVLAGLMLRRRSQALGK